MADGVGSIGGGAGGGFDAGGGGFDSIGSGGFPAPGATPTLDEIGVTGDPPIGGAGGGPRPSSTSPAILAQQSILQNSQAGDTAAAQAFAAFSNENAARADQAQAQFNANQANANVATAKLFSGPDIIGPTIPPGGAFGLNGPVAPPGLQGAGESDGGAAPQAKAAGVDPALAGAGVAARLAPTFGETAGDALGALAGRLPSGAQILGFGGDVLGGLALRAGGLATGILALGTGNIPNDAQESAMQGGAQNSPFYADGSPRLLYPGAPVSNPTPTEEQATPLTPPALTDGFTVPPPPETLTPPAALTPLPGAIASLPGFTPAPALPGLEGLTPTLPQGLGPLPGFAAAPPVGLTIPGSTPAGQTPPLPGFGAADPKFGGLVLEQRGLTAPTGQIGGLPTGIPPANVPYADPNQKAGVASEQDFARVLAAAGYRTVQQPTVGPAPAITPAQLAALGLNPGRNPDLLVEDRIFDIYSPVTQNLQNILLGIADKVAGGQTDRIALDLRGTPFMDAQIRAALKAAPIQGLKEVISLTSIGLGRAFP